MQIRLAEGQYKSISANNLVRIPKFALPVLGCHDLMHIQRNFGEDTTRGSGQSALDQFISGALQ